MNKTIKLASTGVLGAILWILLIVLISQVSGSNWKDDEASVQLVSGLAPTIVALFIFKLIPSIRNLKQWRDLDTLDKILVFWGLVSGDFIFGGVLIYLRFSKNKTKTT